MIPEYCSIEFDEKRFVFLHSFIFYYKIEQLFYFT